MSKKPEARPTDERHMLALQCTWDISGLAEAVALMADEAAADGNVTAEALLRCYGVRIALKDFLTSFTESNLRGGNRRIEAAAALKEVSRETSTHNWGPKSCHLGMYDYERYLSKRKEAANASAVIIKTIQTPKAKG